MKILYIAFIFILLITSCDDLIIKNNSISIVLTTKENTAEKKDTSILVGTTFTFDEPTVTKPYTANTHKQEAIETEVTSNAGDITYTSSDDKIATVNEKTGEVTFVTAGTVTITATKASMLNMYEESIARYTLYITMRPADKDALVAEIQRAMETHSNDVDLNYIDTSSITDMAELFRSDHQDTKEIEGYGLDAFEGDISKWDVSSVTDMSVMFWDATAFNSDISKWDVSSVTDMGGMFSNATAFNSDISKWDVSSVTNMSVMFGFADATAFNGDISSWDVSSVTSMAGMFFGATAFNNDISKWDISSVTDMICMFYGATAFNQNLNDWGRRLNLKIQEKNWLNASLMFYDSGLAGDLPDWCKNDIRCKNEQ